MNEDDIYRILDKYKNYNKLLNNSEKINVYNFYWNDKDIQKFYEIKQNRILFDNLNDINFNNMDNLELLKISYYDNYINYEIPNFLLNLKKIIFVNNNNYKFLYDKRMIIYFNNIFDKLDVIDCSNIKYNVILIFNQSLPNLKKIKGNHINIIIKNNVELNKLTITNFNINKCNLFKIPKFNLFNQIIVNDNDKIIYNTIINIYNILINSPFNDYFLSLNAIDNYFYFNINELLINQIIQLLIKIIRKKLFNNKKIIKKLINYCSNFIKEYPFIDIYNQLHILKQFLNNKNLNNIFKRYNFNSIDE